MFSFLRHHTIHTYNIGFLRQPLDEVMTQGIGKGEIHWMQHRYKDRFFADPFLIKRTDSVLYVLCEEYIFWENKGKIALLEVSTRDYVLLRKRTLIEESFHLSFPNCEEDGNTIVPEAAYSGSCFEYTIDTENWSVTSKKKICEDAIVDTVFFPNGNNKQWGLCTKLTDDSNTHKRDLYIYRNINGLFTRLSDKPILQDARTCRAAGRFFRWKGHILRPVQDCSQRYGRQTIIMDFGSSPDFDEGYLPKELITLNGDLNPPFDETFHTFNVYQDLIVVDGTKHFQRFILRNLCKHCPKLCRLLFRK